MNPEGVLAIVMLFGGLTVVGVSMSPIGHAIASRLFPKGKGGAKEVRRLEESCRALAEDLDAVRRELGELQERVDFAERMLTQQRQNPPLPG